ncbi:hypothetical protein PYW08_013801 [Mythimna loreyi]|uniref:Uncharacterized protein n=1 Tax=Mythimna loreyi TaxID=667449 RepID=A0ACC2R8B2_9NEOP|nr:hypothetical protein PYW08_013801 [Mythimna loreyi]
MPRVQRSPPAPQTITSKANITQSMSDSNIPRMILTDPSDDINITTRHNNKRPRTTGSPNSSPDGSPCCPPGTELEAFKKEIQAMLKNWKSDQEAYLTKICNEQTSSLNKLVADMIELKRQNQVIQKSNAEIEKSVSFISKQYDDIIKKVELLQKENQTYKDSILALETKLQDQQRLSRPSTIEIRNVPCVKDEAASDLSGITIKVGSIIDLQLQKSDFRDVYRLPGKPDTIRPIVVEFTSVELKNRLITASRNFNKTHKGDDCRLSTQSIGFAGEKRPIFISEHLPGSSRKLFFTAKEFAKLNKYDFCWSSNGNIFLRKATGEKQILVRSDQTLRDLEQLAHQ